VVNTYLFLAYALVWIIFMLYAWNLSRRQQRLLKELKDLQDLQARTASDRAPEHS
jgi:CcmD family protein